ncbi:MAG: hypothetical protein HOK72_07820, partial [Flavobacteriales bacterium]|nr:hypothetical protein [Flavobacteriales bacterium]
KTADLKSFYSQELLETVDGFDKEFGPLAETLLTPGNICLDFYRKNGVDTIDAPEERMICDMENIENIRKLIFNLR